MIITIDGYAGAGKSTAARRLADHLGFELLHTGAMYRAAALTLLRNDFDIYADRPSHSDIGRFVDNFRFEMARGNVVLNGQDLTDDVTSEDAGRGASKVGTFPEVRAKLKSEQRRIAAGRDMVCEGRDQGTAVFPDAPVKFFFWASPDVRAARRVEQEREAGREADYEAILNQIVQRDRQDTERAIDPLRPAHLSIWLDTSDRSLDAVLSDMKRVIETWRSRG
ncbi:MAG TPA: (d)CMP kinase [Fimbriiglobus sp.]|jgi:cytidylate kinase